LKTYYAPVEIPGYEDLVVVEEEMIIEEARPCHLCNKNLRHRLKSGRYDSYCDECRSEKNMKYGKERRDHSNRHKTKIGRHYHI